MTHPCPAHEPAEPQGTAPLFSSLYDELRRLARREVWRQGARDVLGTRTLVHEAWLDMSDGRTLAFEGDGPFLAYAARTMRGLVIDRLRARQALKRGGGTVITSLDGQEAPEAAQDDDLLRSVCGALDDLAALEPELAQVVELKFFGGLTLAEIGQLTGVSERTAQRRWEKARALLYRALASDPPHR